MFDFLGLVFVGIIFLIIFFNVNWCWGCGNVFSFLFFIFVLFCGDLLVLKCWLMFWKFLNGFFVGICWVFVIFEFEMFLLKLYVMGSFLCDEGMCFFVFVLLFFIWFCWKFLIKWGKINLIFRNECLLDWFKYWEFILK